MIRFGLRGRAIVFCVALVLGAVGAVGVALIWHNYADSIRKMSEDAVVDARIIGRLAEPAVLLHDREALQRVVRAAGDDEAVWLAQLIDDRGRIVAEFRRHEGFKPETELDPARPIDGPLSPRAYRLERTAAQLHVTTPIWSNAPALDLDILGDQQVDSQKAPGPVGFVHITYSLHRVREELADRVASSVAISTIVIAAGIGATFVLVRQFLTPVRNLVQVATGIADGDLTLRAPERAVGEIGTLARAFNYMADTIRTHTESLETQVRERTAELVAQTRGLVNEVTRRQRIEEQLEIRARQQAAAADFGRKALSGGELPELFDEAVALVSRVLGARHCKVLEHIPEQRQLLLRAGVGWKEGHVGHATVPDGADSQAGYTLVRDETIIVEDLETETRFRPPALLTEHRVVSGMSVTIRGAGGPFGVLGVHTDARRTFTKDDGHFLQGVANVLSEAIERKRAESKIARGAAVTDAVNRILHEGLACDTEEDLAKTCLAVAEELTGSKFGFLGFLNSKALFDTVAISNPGWEACNVPQGQANLVVRNMPIRGIDRMTMRDGESRIVNDMVSHPNRVGVPEGHPPVHCFLGVPLKEGGRTIGMIGLGNKSCRYAASDQEAVEVLSVAMVAAFRRKRAEEQLRLQSGALAAAANTIVITDRNGCIVWVNPAFTKLTGYRSDEAVGQNPRVLKSGEQDEAFYRDLWSTVLSGKVWHGELVNRRKDGSLYTEEMTITPVRDERGNITHFIAIKQDITERKQVEAERIKRLELEQERDHLRNSMRALERVLGVVGHELRTPLAGVRATAELLLMEDAREMEEFDSFLRGINDEVIRMASIINDLLEVARMNSGIAQWNWSRARLAEVCEEALDTLRPLTDPAKLKLALEVRPPDLMMNGDPSAIRRLAVNLLSNAQKHTPEGSISIRAASVAREDGSWVELRVSDTGEGMPAEIARRLGVAFALNSGVVGETHVKGSGLGLAICRGIIAAHGGTISVNTAEGKGTTVTVLLRADLQEPAPIENAADIVCEVWS